jgi:hypothetical protein
MKPKQSKKEWLLCLFNRVERLRVIAMEENDIAKKYQADRLERMITNRLNELVNPLLNPLNT